MHALIIVRQNNGRIAYEFSVECQVEDRGNHQVIHADFPHDLEIYDTDKVEIKYYV